MNILFVAAEVGPFVSVGGLSQVMYFLPNALKKLRHDVRIFTPKYGLMDDPANKKNWRLQMEYEGLRVPIEHDYETEEKSDKKNNVLICNVKSFRRRQASPLVYFLENREYYELRANVFGYKDDHVRFALLSKGVLEWLFKLKRERGWFPDIIHCNDWHTGYAIELGKRDTRYKDMLRKTPLVMTVHNFKFQGNYDFRYAQEEKDNPHTPLRGLLDPELQKQNALRRALLYADAINTVSPTHATEVLTPEYGEGLEEDLRSIRGKLVGILNGIDVHEFDPAHDPIIKKIFNRKFFTAARRENKKEIQNLFLLPEDPQKALIIYVGRLSAQKGWELIIPFLPKFLSQNKGVQIVILGSGDERFQNGLQELQKSFPLQVGLHIRSDFRLPRKLFAGGDMILMPSFFEPGGIVVMEAMRYGTVPIVRRTGGLNDVVVDFNPATAAGNGFSFVEKDPWAFYKAVIEALTIFKQPDLWKKLVRNCMGGNFSWDESAKKYVEWYQHLAEEKKRASNISHPPHYGIPSL